MKELTLAQAQQAVDDWIREIGVAYFSELTNLAQLVEEVGELARIMSRTYGDQSFKEEAEKKDLGSELADILFVLLCIANQTGVDMNKALLGALRKNSLRDKKRHQQNPKLRQAPQTES